MKFWAVTLLTAALAFAAPSAFRAEANDKIKIRLASVPVALHPGLFLAKSRGWVPDVEIEDGTLAKGRQAADLEQLRMEGMICRMSLKLITARRSVW